MLKRSILLLQGVSSPFFEHLASGIKESGYPVYKVNFCGGDVFFSSGIKSWSYRGKPEHFQNWLQAKIDEFKITDVVLFGDTRKMHQLAVNTAKKNQLGIHVFEEGYLRPNWLTLDKGGVNANTSMPLSPEWLKSQEKQLSTHGDGDDTGYSLLPRVWHDIRYHAASILARPFYPYYTTHRPVSPFLEYAGWIKRLSKVSLFHKRSSNKVINNLVEQDAAYYVLPLQLNTDAQIQVHSPFDSIKEVLETTIASFAHHAPKDSHLVIKNHPLDTGWINYKKIIKRLSKEHNCKERILYIEAGHLPTLLAKTKGTVLVNSTVGMSALHHHSPLFAMGKAIYNMEGLTFQGSLNDFWTQAKAPDQKLYKTLRNAIIQHTQINGDFYSTQGMMMAVQGSLKLLDLPVIETGYTQPVGSQPILATENPVYMMKEQSTS